MYNYITVPSPMTHCKVATLGLCNLITEANVATFPSTYVVTLTILTLIGN